MRRRNPEQTTRDWRLAWKRGANLIVVDRDTPSTPDGIALYLRVGPRAVTVPYYDGKSAVEKRRRGVLVDHLYRSRGGMYYERTHLILQSDGLPKLSPHAKSQPHTFWRVAEIANNYLPSGKVHWYHGTVLRDGQPWAISADEFLDEYGTRIDELLALADRRLPTGAYKVTL